MRLPVLKDQSFCPVLSSRAKAFPSTSPPKTKLPAVVNRDEALKYLVGNVQAFFPVRGSKAAMCGTALGFNCSSLSPPQKLSPSFTSCLCGVMCEQASVELVYHRPVSGLYAEWFRLRPPIVPGQNK